MSLNYLLINSVKDDLLISIIDGFESYFDNAEVAAYASSPPPYKSDLKFNDDNTITGIVLINADGITGNENYLHQAKQAMYIIFTGESGECRGGVYWNGILPKDKNCSVRKNIWAYNSAYQQI